MPQSYFIWKGIDSRTMGLTLKHALPIISPEERVKHKEIPGRSGDLTQMEKINAGESAYNSYIQTASFSLNGADKARELKRWLRWNGYLTTSSEPNRRQPARVIGAITLDKISRNMDRWAGEVQFYCEPFKEALTEETVTINDNSHPLLWKVVNNGDVWAKPLIKMTTSGTSPYIKFTMASNSSATRRIDIDMTGLSNQVIYIDCDTMEVYNADKTVILTGRASVTGQRYWPLLYLGEIDVAGDGWSKVEITKRERFL